MENVQYPLLMQALAKYGIDQLKSFAYVRIWNVIVSDPGTWFQKRPAPQFRPLRICRVREIFGRPRSRHDNKFDSSETSQPDREISEQVTLPRRRSFDLTVI